MVETKWPDNFQSWQPCYLSMHVDRAHQVNGSAPNRDTTVSGGIRWVVLDSIQWIQI